MASKMEFKHWCGCITQNYEDGIEFTKMCEQHRINKKYIWIALQHPKEIKGANEK